MTDAFQSMIDNYHKRMALLRETFERDGRLLAVSVRDSGYSILLTRSTGGDAPYRVTSFRDGEPIGHREYDWLEGGGPAQNALAEFVAKDMKIVGKPGAMNATAKPCTFISQPHQGMIYVLEPARRGARKLKASAMPATVTPGMSGREATDQPIPYRSVPLAIRRAARKFFSPG